ncbi:MAG: hypothetical protein M1834_007817 [Cirrosporium novae-zelandiae]|nr:MAG: hypothetical protein M1834_007817 [Cirrosporium novae-zelandiae]
MAEQVGIELEGATGKITRTPNVHGINLTPVLSSIARKRQEATGSQRLSTLWKNKKVLFIALLASFGGLEYGYQQGVLSQCYVMWSFKNEFSAIVNDSSKQGWLTSILQLGGWLGALSSGVFAQVFTRKHTMFVGCLWVILGSYLCAGAQSSAYLYAGRWFTGLGVGTFSAVGPLYNAELAPPEMRGIIVACQQLATTLGIMTSYWIGYGTNYIGGTGSGQSDMAWRLPSIIQGLPAIFLSVCIWFMPFSPRLLMHKGKEAEVLKTLSYLRNLPEDHELVQLEFMEIKSEALFEERHFKKAFPKLAERSGNNLWMREFAQYVNCVNSWDNFKRIFIGGAVMFFQQWSGIDSSE